MTIDDQAALRDELRQFVAPKNILFLSADLTGSTALKQKQERRGGMLVPRTREWQSLIQNFYFLTTQSINKLWTHKTDEILKKYGPQAVGTRMGSRPITWKTVGDEIIYRKYLGHSAQVLESIRDWESVANEVEARLHSDHLRWHNEDISEIRIKLTAWIAEIPLQNRIVLAATPAELPQHEITQDEYDRITYKVAKGFEHEGVSKGYEIDFVGPAIDTGFRLTGFSTDRKFILSADVVYFALTTSNLESDLIYYEGLKPMKGVLGGRGYPIFWGPIYLASHG